MKGNQIIIDLYNTGWSYFPDIRVNATVRMLTEMYAELENT